MCGLRPPWREFWFRYINRGDLGYCPSGFQFSPDMKALVYLIASSFVMQESLKKMNKNASSNVSRALRIGVLLMGVAATSLTGCDQVKRVFTSLTGASATAEDDAAEDQAVDVGVYTVKTQTVPLLHELIGRTVASKTAQVRPQVDGLVLNRLFEEGSFVEEGQALYQIDDSIYRANFEKAQAEAENLKILKDRSKSLLDREATSEQAYEDALYSWKKAEAELELARIKLDYCQVKAPISGKIGLSGITVGALVTNGQATELTSIQQVDPMYIDVNPSVSFLLKTLHEQYAKGDGGSYLQGAKVIAQLEDGSVYPYEGKIILLDNQIKQDMGAVTMRAVFPNPEQLLLPGVFVRAKVEVGVREDGILIPQQSLLRTPVGDTYVWVVGKDSTLERRAVTSERILGAMALIDSGLEAGERVVVEGIQRAAQGVKVNAKEQENIPLVTTFEPEFVEPAPAEAGEAAKPAESAESKNE